MRTNSSFDQGTYLSILTHASADAVKQFAEALIPVVGPIDVVRNRSGLVMLPMTDTVHGVSFYLGEVLVAEAHVRLAQAEGYAACLGRDLQQVLALALIDAAYAAGIEQQQIQAFVTAQAKTQDEAETQLLRQVEATRVEMETF